MTTPAFYTYAAQFYNYSLKMQRYIAISSHLSCIDISNIVIYQCINNKTVYLYIQYFMTDAVAVYVTESAKTGLVCTKYTYSFYYTISVNSLGNFVYMMKFLIKY